MLEAAMMGLWGDGSHTIFVASIAHVLLDGVAFLCLLQFLRVGHDVREAVVNQELNERGVDASM